MLAEELSQVENQIQMLDGPSRCGDKTGLIPILRDRQADLVSRRQKSQVMLLTEAMVVIIIIIIAEWPVSANHKYAEGWAYWW